MQFGVKVPVPDEANRGQIGVCYLCRRRIMVEPFDDGRQVCIDCLAAGVAAGLMVTREFKMMTVRELTLG